ncbi:Diphthamide biosynthesis protein 1 [Borealophlyctis nickersoniae]|nr:Diphthamide biosynthesis protein 1 [Borealophlyctis nickersoniae]
MTTVSLPDPANPTTVAPNPANPSSRTANARKRFVGANRRKQLDEGAQTTDGTIEDAVAQGAQPTEPTLFANTIEGERLSTIFQKAFFQPPSGNRVANQTPDDVLNDAELNKAIEQLPNNYNFEIHKCVWQIRKNGAKKGEHRVISKRALSIAELFNFDIGSFAQLLCSFLKDFSCLLSRYLTFWNGWCFVIRSATHSSLMHLDRFGEVETLVMGDVTYGACCVDDFTARGLNCDFLIHYGHSCLGVTPIKTMYVFVDIGIDIQHFVETVRYNFDHGASLVLIATVQFLTSLQGAKQSLNGDFTITIPQSKPLSPGEILGCTAPKLGTHDALVYLGDGRFHLEAIMIANPSLPAYRYDPYAKSFTRERYDHIEMHALRKHAVEAGKKAKKWGIILGTLGRQGSPKVLDYIQTQLRLRNIPYILILLSEIFPSKLAQFRDIDTWVQVACPRLSIDWGYAFAKPLLTPYEAAVVMGSAEWQERYPMDFYARDSLGPWTPNHVPESERGGMGPKGSRGTKGRHSGKCRTVV